MTEGPLDLTEFIKEELLKALDYEVLDTVTGPAIYGTGDGKKNWVVVKDEHGEWELKPVEGYIPPVPQGLFNTDEVKRLDD